MVTQILNFGLPAQIDVRTVGYDRANNLRLPRSCAADRGDPGHRRRASAAGGRCAGFLCRIDRTRAAQLGLNANTIATNVNVSLSSSEQVTPNFWTDPTSASRTISRCRRPSSRSSSLNDLGNTPVSTDLHRPPTGVPCPACSATSRRSDARQRADQRQPGQHPAGLRGLCQRAGPRSRQRRRRDQQDRGRPAEAAQARQHDPGDRARSRA